MGGGEGKAKGIIPARAGFTHGRDRLQQVIGDHPRSRGVYQSPTFFRNDWNGSSPLARGLLLVLGDDRVLHGIIPARAGFTLRGA